MNLTSWTLFSLFVVAQAASCLGEKTLWFMATQTTRTAHDSYFSFAKAALNTVLLRHSDQLFPVLILGGSHQNVTLPDWLTKLAESDKILILHRNLTFVDREVVQKCPILNHPAFLRLDIPTIVPELAKTLPPSLRSTINFDYALYTDCDVLFYPSFNLNELPKPKVISLGGEMTKVDMANSGVLYINISAMNEHRAGFIEHGKAANFKFNAFDQGYIISYFKDKLHVAELLPATFNWKPYWGNSNKTAILHFHGMKPGRSANCFSNMDSNGCDSPIVSKCVGTRIYVDICKYITNLYHVSPDDMSLSYASALRLFHHMVSLDVAQKAANEKHDASVQR
eukprot:scaffold8452_cov185-Ochromonas_danica.AAC.29